MPGPTVSVGLTPGTKPRPGASRARYWPGVSFTCAWKSPFWSIVARATDFQRAPSKRWSATLPPGKSGRTKPRSVDASGIPWKRTSGATETCAIALRAAPLTSR